MESKKPIQRIRSFREFWPYYLGEHRDPRTRRLHFIGTTIAMLALLLAAILKQPFYLLGALVGGYGPAWFSHFFIEKNRPATFTYPLWSLAADFRLWWWTLTRGRSPDDPQDRDISG